MDSHTHNEHVSFREFISVLIGVMGFVIIIQGINDRHPRMFNSRIMLLISLGMLIIFTFMFAVKATSFNYINSSLVISF